MGELLIPPKQKNVNGPVVFLAGPIQGASDWQKDAIGLLSAYEVNKAHIASPRRPEVHIKGDFDEEDFIEQVRWEHHYLFYAARFGVTLFWCPEEHEHFCNRAYAQTTRGELGMTLIRHAECSVRANMVVGFAPGFSGQRYWWATFRDLAPKIKIFSSLEETCRAALDLVP